MPTHSNFENFNPQKRISTTLRDDLQKLAFDKAISWSEALERGIKEIAFKELPQDTEHTEIRITKKNMIERLKIMIFQIDKIVKELEEDGK